MNFSSYLNTIMFELLVLLLPLFTHSSEHPFCTVDSMSDGGFYF